MKTTRLLRLLSLLGFLLLFAPFYDHCNGGRMKQIESNAEPTVDSTSVVSTSKVKQDSLVIENIEINKPQIDTIQNLEQKDKTPFIYNIYDFIDDDDSENAFEIALLNSEYFEMTFDEFVKEIKEINLKKDCRGFFFILKNTCFGLIIIISFLILVFSFKKPSVLLKFSKYNLILLSITVICLFLEGFFETITQIKWGYYVFIFTNILIFHYSRRLLKSKI